MSKLTVNDVHFSYRTKYITVNAVQGISCSFETGKLYAIVGPSGCGKSTFISLLAGMAHPSSGEVLLDDVPLSKLDISEYRRKSTSFIFQSFNLFPALTVLENAQYPMEIAGTDKKTAKAAAVQELLKVGIKEEQFNKLPSTLSGGEQQRVAIARALVSKAKFFLADEPTGNLDSVNSKAILSIFQDIVHTRDCCVILVTHDLSIAEQADVVVKVKDGKLDE